MNKDTTISTDILIIGGGISGLTTAITAKETDPDIEVLIIDKAVASRGWAGKGARTAGLLSFVTEKDDPEEFVKYCLDEIGFYLNDQNLLRDYAYNTRRLVERLECWGVSVLRDQNNKIDLAKWPFPFGTASIDPDMCQALSKYAKKMGVKFVDRLNAVDLLKEGRRVCGAYGFSLTDGTFYTLMASAVVLACGSQNYDITPIWCSTGFSQAAAYRAGAQMRNVEFGNMCDFARVDREKGYIYYGMHSGAHTAHDHLYTAEGNISQKYRPGLHTSMDPLAAYAWYKETTAGNGPVVADMKAFYDGGGGQFFKFHPEAFRRYMRHHAIADYPFDTQRFEVVPGFVGEMSAVRVDGQMETTVSGLFAVGDSSGSGSARGGAAPTPPAKIHGMGIMNALYMGSKGGPAAVVHAKAIKNHGIQSNLPQTRINALKEKTFAPLNRKDGISPRDIIHKIQDAIAPVDYSMIKTEGRMKEALGIVKEIQQELPQMRAADLHELGKCIDAESMAICAEMFYMASLERKESRGFHFREDFPEQDNENWLKWIIVQNVNDEMKISLEDIPIGTYNYQPK
ncbi:MAG: FAD-dependent oxidoreductase [Peptococcaceae bacterium]|nr:FAD-dependent oxidoreductase [Peptococcaceae bacterium]